MFARPTTTRPPQTKLINGFIVEITFKRVRNINMRLRQGSEKVYVSAPTRIAMREIESFVVSKTSWLQKQIPKMQVVTPKTPLSFEDGTTHFIWGRALTLQTIERTSREQKVYFDLTHLYVPLSEQDKEKKRCGDILAKWYRSEIERAINDMLPYWQEQTNKTVSKISYQSMRSRWGTCMISERHIRLNTELAKHHPKCLEYVLVHELTHLYERGHNARFYGFMDRFLPDWKNTRTILNHPLNAAE